MITTVVSIVITTGKFIHANFLRNCQERIPFGIINLAK